MQFDQLKRRDFITLLGASAWPLAAWAQTSGRMRRIGMQQSRETDAEIQVRIGALRDGLKALGWTEGRDYQFEYRWPGTDPERIRVAAAELVRMAPDVIVVGNTPSALTLRKETTTIPIVFVNLADPVGSGLVATLARPGGNVALQNRSAVIAAAARHRLPAVYPFRFFVTEGGLASYGVDLNDQYRRAASYVDRILKGGNPADLPVQAPDKFELVINVPAAKALGLEVPATVLARADEVIE